ncbi:hypothetical protein GCM10027048_32330 [Hymenobacter coalescens]|uniref:Uncharacterized protein n=1 Tax=Hymenobacter koreensis TaxID=1084523 RepID=A0ABP8JDF3_9BACT
MEPIHAHFVAGLNQQPRLGPLRGLHSNQFVSISYDLANDWLYVDWKAEQTEQPVRDNCLVLLELVKRHLVRRVLNDNRQVQTMWAAAAEWGGTVWFPALADAGVDYFAWIYSPHLYSRLSTDQTLAYTQRPVVLTFEEYETAQRWLQAMSPPCCGLCRVGAMHWPSPGFGRPCSRRFWAELLRSRCGLCVSSEGSASTGWLGASPSSTTHGAGACAGRFSRVIRSRAPAREGDRTALRFGSGCAPKHWYRMQNLIECPFPGLCDVVEQA